MIKVEKGETAISGELGMLLSECTEVLRILYEQMKNGFGDEYAKEQLVTMGKLAVATDEEVLEMVKEKTGQQH